MFKRVAILLFILILFSSCARKEIVKRDKQESAFIILKTPTMKYADMGFIYRGDSFIKVEVYSMGQPILSININGMNICLSTFECMEKRDFNAKMLNQEYPDTLLENIFRGKPIFDSINLDKNSSGFIQKIKKDTLYDITYSVVGANKKFYDKINKIKIEVRVD